MLKIFLNVHSQTHQVPFLAMREGSGTVQRQKDTGEAVTPVAKMVQEKFSGDTKFPEGLVALISATPSCQQVPARGAGSDLY